MISSSFEFFAKFHSLRSYIFPPSIDSNPLEIYLINFNPNKLEFIGLRFEEMIFLLEHKFWLTTLRSHIFHRFFSSFPCLNENVFRGIKSAAFTQDNLTNLFRACGDIKFDNVFVFTRLQVSPIMCVSSLLNGFCLMMNEFV